MNELGELLKARAPKSCPMARWQRLYHKHIASFFNRGLYLERIRTFGRARGVDSYSWGTEPAMDHGLENSSVRAKENEERLRNQKGQA
jgi:hypothetical protein